MPHVLLYVYCFKSLDMCAYTGISLVNRKLARDSWQKFQGWEVEWSVYEGRKWNKGKGKANGLGNGRRGYRGKYKDLQKCHMENLPL